LLSDAKVNGNENVSTDEIVTIISSLFNPRNNHNSSGGFKETKEKEIVDHTGMVRSYGISDDVNVSGMKRSKSRSYVRGFKMFNVQEKQVKYEMQDTHYCNSNFYNDCSLFCVFDGHLGSNCSKELVHVFPHSLKRYLKDIILDQFDDIPYIWKSLYKMVDEKLKIYETEGSTASTALIWKNREKIFLQCANVGDSTAYLFRNGAPIPLSLDHKLVHEYERIRIQEMGVQLEENQTRIVGLNVSRAFGDHFAKEFDTGVIVEPYVSEVYELTENDTHMIIASDGLWDVLTAEQVYEIISPLTDSKVMSHHVLQTALKDPKCQDNVTVVVVSLI